MPGHVTSFQTFHLILIAACEIGNFIAISINDDPKTERLYKMPEIGFELKFPDCLSPSSRTIESSDSC